MQTRLREARRGVGLTQQQVADELHVTRRSVSEWETGIRRPHTHLPELAKLYGVSTSYLLTGAEEAAVELLALRKTVNELYEFVIQLAEKTADDFAAVLELLGAEDAPDSATSVAPSHQARGRSNGDADRGRRVEQEQPALG